MGLRSILTRLGTSHRGGIARDLAPSDVYDHESDFLGIAADIPGEYWSRENLLMELPEKWNLSFAVWVGNRPVAYASCRRRTPIEPICTT